MMSQNRQSAKDRLDAEIDRSVNVRAELAIRKLNESLRMFEKMLAVSALQGVEQQTNHANQTRAVHE